MDPLEDFELTNTQRSMLATAAAAEYRHAATSILEPYGFVLSGDGDIIRSSDVEDDNAHPWDEDAVRDELDAISPAWTLAFARAVSAHNSLVAAQTASAEAQAIREEAIVQAARAGVGRRRLAEAIGVAESAVDRIITEALGR